MAIVKSNQPEQQQQDKAVGRGGRFPQSGKKFDEFLNYLKGGRTLEQAAALINQPVSRVYNLRAKNNKFKAKLDEAINHRKNSIIDKINKLIDDPKTPIKVKAEVLIKLLAREDRITGWEPYRKALEQAQQRAIAGNDFERVEQISKLIESQRC